jgi:hypothetical protein
MAASSSSGTTPLGMQYLVPSGVGQLGINRARSEYGLTDADLHELPYTMGNGHHCAGKMYSTKDLARVAMLKEYRERGQSVVCIARKDIKRSETLVVPFTPSTTIGDVKAMMPGDTDILGHPRLWFLPVREKRPFEYMTLGAQQYGSPMRLYELHADGSAQTLIEAGVPNEALLELTRAEAAIDREPSAEQLAARAARKAREAQEAEARRAEAVAAQAAERLKRQAALEATQAAAAAAKRAEKEAATSLWAQEIAREEQKMAREAEKQAKREAKRQAREQKRPHKEATPNNEAPHGQENAGRQAAKRAREYR